MSPKQEVSDGELVRRLREGDRDAFDALYARHDADVVGAIKRELRGRTNDEHLAREVGDFLWLDLSRHPHYLLRHDYARRPLGAYLTKLARRKAKRFLGRLLRKEIAHPEPPLPQDLVDPLPQLIKRWDRVVELLSVKQLTRLRRVLAMNKRSPADQAWYDRLVRRLRRQLDLGPRRTGTGHATRSSKKFPKESNS